MASTNSASAKTHVSLKLPTYILESIDAHAERESISRTEAFVFYLQTGLDIADTKAEEPSKDEAMLQSIQEELAEIKALLQSQGISVAQVDAVQAQSETHEPTEAAPVMSEETAAESEAYAEESFTGSDAITEESFDTEEDEAAEDEDDLTTSDEIEDDATAPSYAIEDDEEYTEIKPVDDVSDFTTSDEVYEPEAEGSEEEEDAEGESDAAESTSYFSSFYATSSSEDADEVEAEEDEEADEDEGAIEEEFSDSDAEVEDVDSMFDENEDEPSAFDDEEDEDTASEFIGGSFLASDEVEESAEDDDEDPIVDPCDEALSFKKLEKAVAKASKQIDIIEKVWVFGPAADEDEITSSVVDLCVKTDDDKKLKSKHLDPFVAAIEEKTGKLVNVVLRHEVEDKSELQNRVELYKN